MNSTRRPFLVRDHGDDIGDIRARAERLQRRCSELAAELSELVDKTMSLAAAPADEPPALLSVQECSSLLGVSRTTVFSLIGEGALRSVKVGSRRLVPRAAMEHFVAQSGQWSPVVADQRPAV